MEYKIRYDYFFMRKEEEYHENYQKFLDNVPVGIFMLSKSNKELLFYNKAIARLARKKSEQVRSDTEELDYQSITEADIIRVIDSFVQKKDKKTLGEVAREWEGESLVDRHKYKYKRKGHKIICTIKALRLSFRSHESEIFLLENQTAFENLYKLESKYQKLYVASIVHDIRSPLNGVMGIIEKIDMLNINPEIGNCVDIARKTCKLLLFLTYDITDYSQLEAHKFKANSKQVVVKEVFDEITELLSFNFKTKGLTYNVKVTDLVPACVLVDKHRYMQILLNLLTNALKFTFKGSITTEVSFNPVNSQLITSVKDTGIGIKSEDIPNLFKLFGKLESSSRLNPQGVGFGLAMCKKLAEQLGGSIGVESKPGKGSTFTFSLLAARSSGPEESTSRVSTDERPPHATEVDKKMAEHTFRATKFNTWLEGQNESKEMVTSPSSHPIGIVEGISSPMIESDRCVCSKVLIVDDEYCNLLALQNYLRQFSLAADEVSAPKS